MNKKYFLIALIATTAGDFTTYASQVTASEAALPTEVLEARLAKIRAKLALLTNGFSETPTAHDHNQPVCDCTQRVSRPPIAPYVPEQDPRRVSFNKTTEVSVGRSPSYTDYTQPVSRSPLAPKPQNYGPESRTSYPRRTDDQHPDNFRSSYSTVPRQHTERLATIDENAVSDHRESYKKTLTELLQDKYGRQRIDPTEERDTPTPAGYARSAPTISSLRQTRAIDPRADDDFETPNHTYTHISEKRKRNDPRDDRYPSPTSGVGGY
ncbi:MAG: hypothetical protein H6849_03875 [Alphaproteobacteria bacterium]|nr:MAG: hypothetical protein H6849_03875 [Alphaproteobacteria bacterium]